MPVHSHAIYFMYEGDISHQCSLSHMPIVPEQELVVYINPFRKNAAHLKYADDIGDGSNTAVFIPFQE